MGSKSGVRSYVKTSSDQILNVRSKQVGSSLSFTLDVNLGEPYTTKTSVQIPNHTSHQFSTIAWTRLFLDKLPRGVSIINQGSIGAPSIPTLCIRLVVPEGANAFQTLITKSRSKTFTSTYLIPKTNGRSGELFSADKYSVLDQYSVSVSPVARIRELNVISISIPLTDVNVTSGDVSAFQAFTCTISFQIPPQFTGNKFTTTDPAFEQLYSQLVANQSDLPSFRSGFKRVQTKNNLYIQAPTHSFADAITGWIDPQAPYIKLYATRTGLYRMTPSMIAPKYDMTSWHASDLRMFNRGKEVPIWIDSNVDGKVNAIEYFGERLPGLPNEYYNLSSDSNAYWLTNSKKFQSKPLRFVDKEINQTPTLHVSEANYSYHHEYDDDYYGGDAGNDETATLQRNEYVSGERFVWRKFPSKVGDVLINDVTDTLNIASLPSNLSGKFATITVFMRGMSTLNTGSVTHQASIQVNGKVEASPSFNDFAEVKSVFTIPLSDLHVGANQIKIVHSNSGSSNDNWYLDFYSVSLPQPISPSTDTAIAVGQWNFTISPTQSQFNIDLQTNQGTPHLFNLSDTTRLLPSGISTYKENSSNLSRYVAASSLSFLKPDRIDTVIQRFATALDTSFGADYIIITHPSFLNTSLRLASRRRDVVNMRVKVITTEEVFNAFNFGSDEPWALRRYLDFAYNNYHGIPPGLVTLFGDGTWDPKANLNNQFQDISARTNHRSFVPTYGVPNSDYIFTTAEGSTEIDSASFRMVIARIPVETQEEADNYFKKLLDYETSPPADWNRNFLFVSGGDAGFQWGQLLEFNKLYVGLPPYNTNQYGGLGNFPVNANPTFIWRHDFTGSIDVTQTPAIQNSFKDGLGLVYFFGHGAPNITDVQFPDVFTLRNSGSYPVFISVSCRTGAFAEPNIISMNESFVRVPNAGAILALGTTGFGEQNYDFSMSAHIFNFMRGDSILAWSPSAGPHKLNMPIIMTTAKFITSVLEPPLSGGFGSHNSIYEYSILGDAALGLDFRPQPELNITNADIQLIHRDSVNRSVFSVTDSTIQIRYVVRNFGYAINKPVRIRITNNQPTGRTLLFFDSINSLTQLASSGVILSLDSFAVGNNTIQVDVDYDNQFAESNETDNSVKISFIVNGNSGSPFFPPEGSKFFCDITADSLHVITLLPNHNSQPVSLEIDFDTSRAFISPKHFGGLSGTGLFFQHSFSRAELPNPFSKVLWWRSRAMLPGGVTSSWQYQSVSIESNKPNSANPEFSYTSADQLQGTVTSGLQIDPADGALIIPTKDTVEYDIEARGLNDTNVVAKLPIGQFLLNGKAPYTTTYPGGNFIAFVMLQMTADSSSVLDTTEFVKSDNDSVGQVLADSLSRKINGLPDGRRVVIFTNFAPIIPGFTFNPKVKSALQSLGSLSGMDGLGTFGTYALIGKKGLPPGKAKEKFSGDQTGGVSLLDTVVVNGTEGFAQTASTAIATSYGKLRWIAENINSGSNIEFSVLGIRKSNGVIERIASGDAAALTSIDLSGTNFPATFWDKVFVQMHFVRSTSSSLSPKLRSVELEYDPAPEFYIHDSAISLGPRVQVEGNPVVAKYQIENVTCTDATNVPVQIIQHYHGSNVILANDTIKSFFGHSSVSFTHEIQTTGFGGDVGLTVVVNPGGVMNEQLTFNNSANANYTVVRDSTKPRLELLFDGRRINSGDYVSSKVTTEIRLLTQSTLRLTDSSSIKGILQPLFGQASPLPFSGSSRSDSFQISFRVLSSGLLQGTLDITPNKPLKQGRYSFTAMANDANGNRTDTVSQEFVISQVNGLEHVMNYPNPFKTTTWFTFILKSNSPADVKVIVYAISGRIVRTLALIPTKQHVGLNAIEWDGKDQMGNDVANGTYLYRVVLNGTNDDASPSTDAATERIVRSR